MPCLRASAAIALTLMSAMARAQEGASTSRASFPGFRPVGSSAEDRARLDDLLDGGAAAPHLLRFATATIEDTSITRWPRLRRLPSSLDLTWNSAIPYSMNDGPQWAGAGMTVTAGAGVFARIGALRVTLAPRFWATQNKPFAILPGADSTRSGFSSPWNFGLLSMDLPIRMGRRSTVAVDLGETAVWLESRGISAGVSTESQWWGPGIRNALIMSNNAGGFPHAFLRPRRPVRTRWGTFDGRWIVGALSESRFFDSNVENDVRALSGAIVTFVPAGTEAFAVGAARVVYSMSSGPGAVPGHAFDFIYPSVDSTDQLTSFFARYVLPASRAEVYGEWGRMRLPKSVGAFLLAPQYTQAFTIGLQWLPTQMRSGYLRVQAELTDLEQSPPSRSDNTRSWYTSRAVTQGYTQRGQVLGAAIGPGSSSQFFALDHVRRDRTLGGFVERIRWNTDAYYTQPTSVFYFAYDVTVMSGVRASYRRGNRGVSFEAALQRRYNFLFQNVDYGFSRDGGFDKMNLWVRLRVD